MQSWGLKYKGLCKASNKQGAFPQSVNVLTFRGHSLLRDANNEGCTNLVFHIKMSTVTILSERKWNPSIRFWSAVLCSVRGPGLWGSTGVSSASRQARAPWSGKLRTSLTSGRHLAGCLRMKKVWETEEGLYWEKGQNENDQGCFLFSLLEMGRNWANVLRTHLEPVSFFAGVL